ncbi:MAG: LTA synthase family protein [Myxococcota bacterium]
MTQSESVEVQPGPSPTADTKPPKTPHEVFVTLGIALLFSVLMIVQEHSVLTALTDGGPIPYLLWRLIWPLFLIALAFLFPFRARIVFLGVMGMLWSFVVIGDAAYFRFFGSVTSLVSAGTVHQLWDVKASVLDVLNAADWIYPPAFLALSALAILPRRLLVGQDRAPMAWRQRKRAGLCVAGVLTAVTLISWFTPIYEDTHHLGRDKWVMPIDHWGSRYSYGTYASTFGLYNYHAKDLASFLEIGVDRAPLTEERVAEIDAIVERKQALNRIDTPLSGIASGRRIVVIQLEAIVHWLLDLEADSEPVMPFLSSLTRQGLSWDYVMDVTAMGRTSDAEFAVMTGLLPDTSRPNSFAHPDRAKSYLPRTLAEMGYSTASYHGHKMSFWNRTYTHPTYGFEKTFFDEVYGSEEVLGLGVPDGVVYDYMIDRIADDGPLSFSFMISLSSHHPFVYTPASYNEKFPSVTPADGWGLLGPYLRSARYTDDALASFFADMEAHDMLKDTVFVIYGDHDTGALHTEKTLPGMSQFAYTVAEERVPFVVVIPGQEETIANHRAAHTTATAGLHDTFPTLMHLLGEPVPYGVLGTNLLVPDELRDPVPLLSRLGDSLFAYRQCIHTSRGSGCPDPEKMKNRPAIDELPSLIEGSKEQVIVRLLLDHPEYWAEGQAPAKPAAQSGEVAKLGAR